MITIRKEKLPLPFRTLATVFIGLGLYSIAIVHFISFGLLSVLVGIVALSMQTGLAIDPVNKRLNKYTKILWFQQNNWQTINDAKYISIVRVILRHKYNFLSISRSTAETMCKVNLIFPGRKYIPMFTGKYEDVMPMAKELAKGMDLNIYDNSQGKKEWIYEISLN